PGDVKIWDLTRPQEYLTAARPGPGADQEVESLAFAGDARLVLLRRDGVVRAHDAATGVPTGERRLTSPLPLFTTPAAAAFSPGGRGLAVAVVVPGRPDEDGVWDAAEGKRLHTLRGRALRVVSLAWSGDARRLAVVSLDPQGRDLARELTVWDADGGVPLAELATAALPRPVAGVTASVATLSPDGGWVAFDEYATEQAPQGGPGRPVTRVRVHAVPGGAERAALHLPAVAVRALAFSADGRWLAVYSGDGRLGVYEAATGRALPGWPLQGPAMMPGVAASSPDGRPLAAADRAQGKVWEVGSAHDL